MLLVIICSHQTWPKVRILRNLLNTRVYSTWCFKTPVLIFCCCCWRVCVLDKKSLHNGFNLKFAIKKKEVCVCVCVCVCVLFGVFASWVDKTNMKKALKALCVSCLLHFHGLGLGTWIKLNQMQSSVHHFIIFFKVPIHFINKLCMYLPEFILVNVTSFMPYYFFSINSCFICFGGNVRCSTCEQLALASSHKNGRTKVTEYQQFKYV